jgi:hypothetical protein
MATALDPSRAEPLDNKPLDNELLDKQAPGRGAAIIVYMLFLGSVMAVVTAPVGAY